MSSNADRGGDTFARQPRRDPYAMKGKSTSAIGELRGRLGDPALIPGTAGALLSAIGKKSLEAQIAELQAGARPVQIKTDKGETITVGTVRDGKYTGRSEYREIALADKGTGAVQTSLQAAMEQQARQRANEGPGPEITPEVTPEITPVKDTVDGTLMGQEGETRRTRFQRRRGGTLTEGGGVLYSS